jgi:hypothetical protein
LLYRFTVGGPVAVIVLGLQLHRQQLTVREQQVRLTELTAKNAMSEANAKSNLLDYQEKCAEQAKKAFTDLGYKPNEMAGYENHYNKELNKCFIVVENTDAKYAPTIWTNKSLFDAYEGKSYGEYSWHTVKDKKYWEVAPFTCKVVMPSGDDKYCASNDEFEELIKGYMKDR